MRQAERLAAKYDPSGKSFNVGPVIVLPDGRVKSKEVHERAEEAKLARERGEDVNPERAASSNSKMSNNQLKKMEALKPAFVPAKPVLPKGVSLPEGEENWLALWDVDDGEIEKGIARQKNEKKRAAKALRRKQQEQKKFNRALKVKKKEADKKGVLFDPELAAMEVLGELSEEEKNAKKENEIKAEKSEDSESDSDSSSDDSSDSDSGSDSDGGVKIEEPQPKRKRAVSESAEDEPATKKAKSSEQKKKHSNIPKLNKQILDPADIAARIKKEPHRLKLEAKRVAKLEQKIAEGDHATLVAVSLVKKEKGGKKDETPEERDARRAKRAEKKAKIEAKRNDPEEQARRAKLKEGYKAEKEKKKEEKREARRAEKVAKAEAKRKKSSFGKEKKERSASIAAEQWNPDALSGDAARKDKFLRLLGAGKSSGNAGAASKSKGKPKVDIEKVQSELERQYDAGMKMKHEGGGKRRGLGA